MRHQDKITIRNALRRAKYAWDKGLRYYDNKYNTYNPASEVESVLEHVNDLIGYYGLEAYDPNETNPMRPRYQYVNSGDSYGLTLVYDRKKGHYKITDIGSIIERHNMKN